MMAEQRGESHGDRQWRLYGPGYFVGRVTELLELYRPDGGGIAALDAAILLLGKLRELEADYASGAGPAPGCSMEVFTDRDGDAYDPTWSPLDPPKDGPRADEVNVARKMLKDGDAWAQVYSRQSHKAWQWRSDEKRWEAICGEGNLGTPIIAGDPVTAPLPPLSRTYFTVRVLGHNGTGRPPSVWTATTDGKWDEVPNAKWDDHPDCPVLGFPPGAPPV